MNWLAWASGALKINRLVKLIPELRTLLEFEAVEEGNDDLQEEAVSASIRTPFFSHAKR